MAVSGYAIRPGAHVPLRLGRLRQLESAAVMERRLPPPPAHVRAYGTGVEALVLARLDGPQALYQVGPRREERGRWALLQAGVSRASRHADRLGQGLEACVAAHLHTVFRALALNARTVAASPTLGLPHETTTRTLYGAYAGDAAPPPPATAVEAAPLATPVAPRPVQGSNQCSATRAS